MEPRFNQQYLRFIFGPDSNGETPEERAKTTTRQWVRSQDALSLFDGDPKRQTGLVISSVDALRVYGIKILDEALDKRSAVLVCDYSEPAGSIKRMRNRLNITQEELAEQAGLDLETVKSCENPDKRNLMRDLIKICEVLGADPLVISFRPLS